MQFKFLHCNIWNGGKLISNLIAFLQKEKPDVLAMQEVYNGHDPTMERRFRSIEVLQEATGLRHFAFAPAFSEDLASFSVQNGNAVLSRFPVMKHEHWFYDRPYDPHFTEGPGSNLKTPYNLQHVVLDLPGRNLHVYNTHGIWGNHGRDTERRLQMAQFILEKMSGIAPAALCGDFNVDEGTQTIANLSAALVNVFAPDRRKSSFNLDHKAPGTGYGTAVVDFVFTTPDVTTLTHRQPEDDVTDHRPLVCEFTI